MDNACIIAGIVEKIVFRNEENGYTIALVQLDKDCEDQKPKEIHKKTVTCVGTLLTARPFDHRTFTGSWTCHPRYGQQFAFTESEAFCPQP